MKVSTLTSKLDIEETFMIPEFWFRWLYVVILGVMMYHAGSDKGTLPSAILFLSRRI